MRTPELAAEIQRQIKIGMPRSELQERIAKIPTLDSVYVPRDEFFADEEKTANGVPLSGRLTVSTPTEIEGAGAKASAHFDIVFDEQDRVVDYRVAGFGFKKPD